MGQFVLNIVSSPLPASGETGLDHPYMKQFFPKIVFPAVAAATAVFFMWHSPGERPAPSGPEPTFAADPQHPVHFDRHPAPEATASDPYSEEPRAFLDDPAGEAADLSGPLANAITITEGPASGKRLWLPSPEEYTRALSPPHAARWADFRQRHPGVDPTELEAFHRVLLEERHRLPTHLGDAEREAYGAWLQRVESLSEAMVRARAEQLGIPVSGTDGDGREFLLTGFDGAVPLYAMAENREAAVSTAASFLRRNADFNQEFGPDIDGSGFYVNVNDSRRIAAHPEFRDDSGQTWRFTVVRGTEPGGHATHVAGTIAARGLQSRAQGMAPAAHVYTMSNTHTGDVYNLGMDWPGRPERSIVGNSSLGVFNPSLNGVYTSTSAGYDQAHFDTPHYLHFYAAGNSGSDYFSLSTTRKDAKNLFAVGNVSDVTRNAAGVRTGGGSIANSSARGPTRDGRVKPDIVANGIGLYSTNAELGYDSRSGTSMASPNAAGSAILLQDYFNKRLDGHLMRASTLMALIINTTDDMGSSGPNYTSGWGLMNTLAAGRVIQAYAANPAGRALIEDRLHNGEKVEIPFLSDSTGPIRTTLVWTDPPGPARTSNTVTDPVLVNNLNVRLIGPDGTAHYPYVMPYVVGTATFPPFSEQLLPFPATTGVNFTDNKIQVRINQPLPGEYTVEISHEGGLTGGFQNYSLAVTGMTAALPPAAPVITTHPEGGLSDSEFVRLTVEGEGFLLGADVEFRRAGFEPVRAYAAEVTGRQILARVDHTAMEPGAWEVAVRNPDGLETISETPYMVETPMTHTWTGAAGNDLLFSEAGFANWDPELTADQMDTTATGATGNTFVLDGGASTPTTGSNRLSASVPYANIGRLVIDNTDGGLPSPLVIGANQPGVTSGRVLRFTLPNATVISLTENVSTRVAIGTDRTAHGFLGIRLPDTGVATFHVAHPDATLDFSELFDNWSGRGALHSGSTNQEDDRGWIRKTGPGALNLATPDAQGNRVKGLIIEGGLVTIGKNPDMGWLPSTTLNDHVVINGGTLHFDNFGANSGGTRGFQLGAKGGGFKLTGAHHALLGVVGDIPHQNGVLVKTGETALRLANANIYSGGTVVREGRLRYTLADSLGSGVVILENGTWISAWQNGIAVANDLEIEGETVGFGGDGYPTIWDGNIDLMEEIRTLRLADHAFFNGTVANGGIVLAAETPQISLHLNGTNTFTESLTAATGRLHVNGALPGQTVRVEAEAQLIAGPNAGIGEDWRLTLSGGQALLTALGTAFAVEAIAGHGLLNGHPIIGGGLFPGTESTTGLLTIAGSAQLAEGSVTRFKIDSTEQTDRVEISSGALWNGMVEVVFSENHLPAAGQEFALVSVGVTSEAGSGFAFSLPPPGPGLEWDTSAFFENGTLALVASDMSDYEAWAASFGLSGPDAEPGADPDKDGLVNWLEFLLGFDPTDPDSTLRARLEREDGQLRMIINRVVPAGLFAIEISNHPGGPWLPVETLKITAPAENHAVDLPAPDDGPRFYRLRHTAP